VSGVLDGDIDELVEGYLRWRRAESDESAPAVASS
jgi:hypothetical protein